IRSQEFQCVTQYCCVNGTGDVQASGDVDKVGRVQPAAFRLSLHACNAFLVQDCASGIDNRMESQHKAVGSQSITENVAPVGDIEGDWRSLSWRPSQMPGV